MSSRVHKTSEKYVEARPDIDRVRGVARRRRNARRNQERQHTFNATMKAVHDSLPHRPVKELRSLAKEMEIKGAWRMSKDALIEAIREKLP